MHVALVRNLGLTMLLGLPMTAAMAAQEPVAVGREVDANSESGSLRADAATSSEPTSRNEAPTPIRAVDAAALESRWGIKIESLRLTAGGYMLDFRYTVLDATKAAPLFERKLKPTLKDEKSGVVVAVPVPPKTGSLRNSNPPLQGKTYFMFFANPGHVVAPYSKVTVTIGDFSVSGLTVRQ